MTRLPSWLMVIFAVVYAVLGGRAISAPGQIRCASAERARLLGVQGIRRLEVISVSHSGDVLAVILGNPEMIAAYQAGVPGNGKPFPDGAKMAKIHWNAKKSAEAPAPTAVPDSLHDVDVMVRDSKRFANSGNWGYGQFNYDSASDTFHTPGGWRRVRVCVPHDREVKGLRLHGVSEAVNGVRRGRRPKRQSRRRRARCRSTCRRPWPS